MCLVSYIVIILSVQDEVLKIQIKFTFEEFKMAKVDLGSQGQEQT